MGPLLLCFRGFLSTSPHRMNKIVLTNLVQIVVCGILNCLNPFIIFSLSEMSIRILYNISDKN